MSDRSSAKRGSAIAASALALALALASSGCGLQPGGINIPTESAQAWLADSAKDVYLLDVRSSSEAERGSIPGVDGIASYWDWPESFQALSKPPRKDQAIIVYCTLGVRSSLAAKWLRAHGYAQVYNLAGGIHAWNKAGGAVERLARTAQSRGDHRDIP